jgi:hypothetical protein
VLELVELVFGGSRGSSARVDGPHATEGQEALSAGERTAAALSNKLPLYTHNVDDFTGLEGLLDIVAVPSPSEVGEPDAQPDLR